jgi:hypothetical protein
VWPDGANRGKWITWKGRVGRALWLLLCSKVIAPYMYRLRTVLFWPRLTSFALYWPHVGFMGPVKPSSPVTTLSNRSSFEVVCWRENEVAQDDGWAGRLLGANTSSREHGPRFDLEGTSRTVVIHETWEAKHTTCWLGYSTAGCTPIRITVTLSYMSDCLLL